MDFMTSVKTCLAEKYAEFNGRASRPEFWWFVLFCLIVNVVAGAIFRGWISSLISLALFVLTGGSIAAKGAVSAVICPSPFRELCILEYSESSPRFRPGGIGGVVSAAGCGSSG